MKRKRIIIIPLVLFAATVCAQSKQFIPPGTVRINDTLFADKEEVNNIGWREYLYFLKRFDSTNEINSLPDTLAWGIDSAALPMQEHYFRHPMFNTYPVTGISYRQALAYCAWRTAQVNFGFYIKENKITDWEKHIQDVYPIVVYYRLPTEKEWEILASGKKSTDVFPFGVDSVYRKWKKKYVTTFNCLYPEEKKKDSLAKGLRYFTAAGGSYWANGFRLYNMIGNVAEMVQEEGIAKGGSFVHQLEDCKIKKRQPYTRPERWLGFRCVAVIVK